LFWDTPRISPINFTKNGQNIWSTYLLNSSLKKAIDHLFAQNQYNINLTVSMQVRLLFKQKFGAEGPDIINWGEGPNLLGSINHYLYSPI